MGMALTTVSELRTTLGVGTLYPDATLQEVCDATDAVLLPMLWANNYFNVAHSNTATTGTLYFAEPITEDFYVGQTVVVGGNGSKHNGSKTITAVGDYSITYAITGNNNTAVVEHKVMPYGTVAAETYVDWSLDMAVQQAALMVSVEIWQARTATLSGSNLVDFQPSPYRMSAQLLAKVRGLIAHALDPRSMVG
jgi:hypothetical protein